MIDLINVVIFPHSVRLNYKDRYIQVKTKVFEENFSDIVLKDYEYVLSNYGVVWGFR